MALLVALAFRVAFSPIRYLLRVTISLLSPPVYLLAFVYNSLAFLLGQPFALTVAVETLYIYCGTAAIVGGIAGSITAVVAYTLFNLLDLVDTPVPISKTLPQLAQQINTSPLLSAVREQSIPLPLDPFCLSSNEQHFPSVSTILEEEEEDVTWTLDGTIPRQRTKPMASRLKVNSFSGSSSS